MADKYRPGLNDRVTYNGDRLDEIVTTGPQIVHLEAMGWHNYYLSITVPGGKTVLLYLSDPYIVHDELPGSLHEHGDDLSLCPVQWRTKDRRTHRCEKHDEEHAKHRCECRSVKR